MKQGDDRWDVFSILCTIKFTASRVGPWSVQFIEIVVYA